jgi:hypothetical protein
MANRLLPFRQYNEHFVVNMFALDTSLLTLGNVATNTHAATGNHDAGLLVKVKTGGDLGAGYSASPDVDSGGTDTLDTYLGKTSYPHVASNANPEAFGKLDVAGGLDICLGVTLNQTLTYDENGEKMLYYRQKALELQAVLPGEAVPVLTKGIIAVAANGVVTASPPEVGKEVALGTGGKFRTMTGTTTAANALIGTCLAVGDRDDVADSNSPDYWAGAGTTGAYYVIKLDL